MSATFESITALHDRLPHLADFGLVSSQTRSTYREVRLTRFACHAPKLGANEKPDVTLHYANRSKQPELLFAR